MYALLFVVGISSLDSVPTSDVCASPALDKIVQSYKAWSKTDNFLSTFHCLLLLPNTKHQVSIFTKHQVQFALPTKYQVPSTKHQVPSLTPYQTPSPICTPYYFYQVPSLTPYQVPSTKAKHQIPSTKSHSLPSTKYQVQFALPATAVHFPYTLKY